MGLKKKTKAYHLKCPNCSRVFKRKFGKLTGNTSCPSCSFKMSRKESICNGRVMTGHERKSLNRIDRKKSKAVSMLKKINPNVLGETIRGNQIPNSRAEAIFKSMSFADGRLPHRPSWPDFLMEMDNQLVGVEVKSKKDSLSKEQRETFELLESYGIPIYIWKEGGNWERFGVLGEKTKEVPWLGDSKHLNLYNSYMDKQSDTLDLFFSGLDSRFRESFEFKKSLENFIEHRELMNKPLLSGKGSRAITMLVKDFNEHDVPTCIQALKKSIRKRWRGVYF